MDRRLSLLVLGLIVLVALVLRVWDLGVVPFGRDEFLDINATVGFAKTGVWQAWDHNLGQVSARINPDSDARAWIYRVQIAQLFEFLPPTEAVARSVSVAWGVVTTLLVYWAALAITRRREIGLIAAGVFALSIGAIEIDRTLRMYAMFAPVFLVFATFLYLTLERDARDKIGQFVQKYTGLHVWYGICTVLVGFLALQLHLLTVNIAFVLAIYLVAMAVIATRKQSWRNKYLAWLVVGLILLMIAFIFFAQSITGALAGLKFFENHYNYIGIILRDFAHPLIGLAFIIGGVVALARSGQISAAMWLASVVGVIVAAAIFLWDRVVGPQYIFFVVPFVSILVGSGVYHLARYLHAQIYGRWVFGVVLAIAFVIVPNYGYFFEENNTYGITSRAERPDYRKVFTYVKKNHIPSDVIVTRNFRNYYWSGLGVKVYDFGSERSNAALKLEGKVQKVTEGYIAQIVRTSPSGWVVFSDNDEKFITKEARAWMAQNLRKVSHANLRGKITIYRWNN